jgi:hypothetical protein
VGGVVLGVAFDVKSTSQSIDGTREVACWYSTAEGSVRSTGAVQIIAIPGSAPICIANLLRTCAGLTIKLLNAIIEELGIDSVGITECGDAW